MEHIIRQDNHIHSCICRDVSRAEAFALRAVELGLESIGISDHAPLSQFPQGDRIPVGMTAEYCRRVRELADKYKDMIDIKLGIEMDFRPGLEGEIEKILAEGDFDYVIGSSHLHVAGMLDRPLSELTAQEYVELCYENNLLAVKSGYFDILAHVDMYRWVIEKQERFKLRDKEFAIDRDAVCELFSEMAKRGTALEINTHLMGNSGNISLVYPALPIMELAEKYPLTYSYGSDAHAPEGVGCGKAKVEASPVFDRCFDKFINIKKRS